MRTQVFKTSIAIAVSVAMFTALFIVAATGAGAAGSFKDDDGNVHEPMIEAIAAAGITKGCGPLVYCPDAPVTRAQMASFLVRAFGVSGSSENQFSDIGGSPHADDIRALAASGLTKGCDQGLFCPDANVTRAEMATFLARALELDPVSGSNSFSDDDGSLHEANIEAIAKRGVTVGCGGGQYCPWGAVSRGQMATFLGRGLELDPVVAAPLPAGTVRVSPSDDLKSLIGSNPVNTVFSLSSGVHRVSDAEPKDGQQFIGDPGAIISGAGQAEHAFDGGGDGVVIDNLIFENFATPFRGGVIMPWQGENWIIQNSEFRYNAATGLIFQSGFKVLNNNIHHNGQMGMKGYGVGALVEGNEIAYNNYEDRYDPNNEAGGTKFIQTQNLIVRNNYVHNNHGPGLWTDIDNVGTLYEGNRTEYNHGPGILHEVSYSAVIRGNIAIGNAHEFYVGGILVSGSTGVEVTGNTVAGNDGGIIGLESTRNGDKGPYIVDDLWVHDNDISVDTGYSGLWSNVGSILYQRNNRFTGNRYVSTVAKPFRWQNAYVDWATWNAAGMDVSGSIR